MSTTYEIVCHDCKEHMWIGQSPLCEVEKGYIYKTDKALDFLQKFLFNHIDHRLQFCNQYTLETFNSGYTEIDTED